MIIPQVRRSKNENDKEYFPFIIEGDINAKKRGVGAETKIIPEKDKITFIDDYEVPSGFVIGILFPKNFIPDIIKFKNKPYVPVGFAGRVTTTPPGQIQISYNQIEKRSAIIININNNICFGIKCIAKKIESDDFDKNEVKKTIKNVEKKLSELKSRKEEAEEDADAQRNINKQLETELQKEIAEKLFDKTQIGREKKDLLALQHQIIHTAGNITWSLDSLIDAINEDKPKSELIEDIKDISLEVQRIVSASRFVTMAGFNTQAEKITKDIVSFINEYVNNIYIPADSFIHKKRPIKISTTHPNFKKEMKFRPFEITVILDNLFSNSRKAKATKVSLDWKKDKTHLLLYFKDNGSGIPDEVKDNIFKFRYSNTDGSGIGLYHVRDILEKYKSKIEFLPNSDGAEFLIKIPL